MHLFDTHESLVRALAPYASAAELTAHTYKKLNKVIKRLGDLMREFRDYPDLRIWITRADLGLSIKLDAMRALAPFGVSGEDLWGLTPEDFTQLLQVFIDHLDRPDLPSDEVERQLRRFLGITDDDALIDAIVAEVTVPDASLAEPVAA